MARAFAESLPGFVLATSSQRPESGRARHTGAPPAADQSPPPSTPSTSRVANAAGDAGFDLLKPHPRGPPPGATSSALPPGRRPWLRGGPLAVRSDHTARRKRPTPTIQFRPERPGWAAGSATATCPGTSRGTGTGGTATGTWTGTTGTAATATKGGTGAGPAATAAACSAAAGAAAAAAAGWGSLRFFSFLASDGAWCGPTPLRSAPTA